MRAILYYTDNRINPKMQDYVCRQILEHKPEDMRLVSVSQKPMDFGENICVGIKPRNHLSMFEQIEIGLERIFDAAIVFFCEHDVLYPPGYFDYLPDDLEAFSYVTEGMYYYRDAKFRRARGRSLSTLVTSGVKALGHYRQRLYRWRELGMVKGGWQVSEPGMRNNTGESVADRPVHPNLPVVDIRHANNLSNSFRDPGDLDEIPFWPPAAELAVRLGLY